MEGELLEEALLVTRSPDELKRLEDLVPDWRTHPGNRRPYWEQQEEIKKSAESVWQQRLGELRGQQSKEFRRDLVQAHAGDLHRVQRDGINLNAELCIMPFIAKAAPQPHPQTRKTPAQSPSGRRVHSPP